MLQDIRLGLRMLARNPGVTALAVIALALGIGGNTMIFSVVNAVLLRPLPVSDPARLYRVGDGNDCCVEGGPQDRWGMFSYPLYERLKAESPAFEDAAAFNSVLDAFLAKHAGWTAA